MKNSLKRKAILFIIGFCLYAMIELIYRGYTYPLMGIVGGLMMLILDGVNNYISWDINILWYGVIGCFSATLMELIIGELAIKYGFHQMWDYSNLPLNFDGVICVPFSIVWFFLSYVGVFVADAVNYYVYDEQPVPYYKFGGKVILRFKEKAI